jgi:uncharacterized protein (TIGR00730 family)
MDPIDCPIDTRSNPLTDPQGVLRIVTTAVYQLWDVVNTLAQLRPPRLPYYSVTIFGSARIQLSTPDYDNVRRLAHDLAKLGCRIVTGGGPGLMQAANEGAYQADPENKAGSVGIRVDLPFEQSVNAYVGDAYLHKTFFSRLHHFMLVSDAFIVMPGGIGTLLEAAMVWQLLQVKKLYNTPLILVGPMWCELVDWAKRTMTDIPSPLASAVDMTIPRCVPAVDDAIALITADRACWRPGV